MVISSLKYFFIYLLQRWCSLTSPTPTGLSHLSTPQIWELLICCCGHIQYKKWFFKFSFRQNFSVNKKKSTKSNKTTKTKESEEIMSGGIPTPAFLRLWIVPLSLTHKYTHNHTLPWTKVLLSHHHRYPIEVFQRNLTTLKVAKSLPFCVTAGNNTYTCLADSFCRSPLCVRLTRKRRGEAGFGGVWRGFWTLFSGQCGQRWWGTSEALPERCLKHQPMCLPVSLSIAPKLLYLCYVCLGG